MTAAGDFLKYRLPSMAVACPACHKRAGVHCQRPSGHKAMMLHKERHLEADRVWLALDLPTITAKPDGTFVFDGPETRPSASRATPQPGATPMKPKKSKAKKKPTTKRKAKKAGPRIVGRLGSKTNPPRIVGTLPRVTKQDELAAFLTGTVRSIDAVCAEFAWLPHSARASISRLGSEKGLAVKTEKVDGATTYTIEAAR